MIPTIPLFVTILFLFTTFIALTRVYKILKNATDSRVSDKTNPIMAGIILWLVLQAALALTGVYSAHLNSMPPFLFRFGFLPVLLLFLYVFISKPGRVFLNALPLKEMTYLHIIRIPIEIGLFLIYYYGAIPKLMTFEGGNLDILSGLTAPVIGYLYFGKQNLKPQLLLVWNLICLALLFNIVSRALLAAPFPFQKMAFDQPNIAILHFPFVWLPTFMVMAVLFSHLASIRKLILGIRSGTASELRK